MRIDISGYSHAGVAHVLGYDIHLDHRFPGGGGVLVAQAQAETLVLVAEEDPWVGGRGDVSYSPISLSRVHKSP